ncbi:MAG: hypothetical protein QXY52_04490 [Conexivisphaerales archaeon]
MAEQPSDEELKLKADKVLKLLLIEPSSIPGMKGWELKKHLGKDYLSAIKVAAVQAEGLGMKIAVVPDEDEPENMDRARFVIMTKEPLSDLELSRWMRIEEVAGLAILISEITIRGGAAPVQAVERLLIAKLPKWRVNQIISKLKRLGYIKEENGLIMKDWRSKLEIDDTGLIREIITSKGETDKQ